MRNLLLLKFSGLILFVPLFCGNLALADAKSKLEKLFDDSMPARWNTPIAFAREGRKTRIALPDLCSMMFNKVDLVANGMPVISNVPVERKNMRMEFEITFPARPAPRIGRLPIIVYRVVVGGRREESAKLGALGEIVVYPQQHCAKPYYPYFIDRDHAKATKLLFLGAPSWFTQWADVVNLPITCVKNEIELREKLSAIDRKKNVPLVIVGYSLAYESLDTLWKRYENLSCNILVLGAKWLHGGGSHGVWRINGTDMKQRACIATKPSGYERRKYKILEFYLYHVADGTLNRWPVIRGCNDFCVVEVFACGETSPAIMTCGINWPEQLGRKESADFQLMKLIYQAAATKPKLPGKRIVSVVWPKDITPDPAKGYYPIYNHTPLKPNERTGNKPSRVYAITSEVFPSFYIYAKKSDPEIAKVRKALEEFEKKLRPEDMVLITGNHPMLYDWKWLDADQVTKSTSHPQVVWLPSNRPSRRSLTRILTQLGVKITPNK